MSLLDDPASSPAEVASFNLAECLDKFRIVALGDSTTECLRIVRENHWTGLLEGLLGPRCRVINAGMGGSSSSFGLSRWHRDVMPVDPHCVLIGFLLNDSHIRHYESPSSYVVQCTPDRMDGNLRIMVELTRAAGGIPALWTPPPVPNWRHPDWFPSQTHIDIQVDICNFYLLTLERVARDLDVPIANFWRVFPGLVDSYPGPYFDAPDGYHSNERSQPIIAQGIAEVVRPLHQGWKSSKTR